MQLTDRERCRLEDVKSLCDIALQHTDPRPRVLYTWLDVARSYLFAVQERAREEGDKEPGSQPSAVVPAGDPSAT